MPLRLAILSFWHVHAPDYARQASDHPGTEITAVWDKDPPAVGPPRRPGKHIFTEKVLAPTPAECVEITAAEKSGIAHPQQPRRPSLPACPTICMPTPSSPPPSTSCGRSRCA
ncbi:hypothetical protein [Nonomuraea jabiensis]|uniref:hypothetical protein n=1 Tax=Nonomuraea jabiensis TaxID=882448 RepID=UPI003D74CADE